MRVVLLAGPSTGGIGTHVAQLAGDLRRGGDDVRVVAPADTLTRFDVGPSLAWWPTLRRPAGGVGDATAETTALTMGTTTARTIARVIVQTARVGRLLRSADVVHAHGHQAGLMATVLLLGRRRPASVVSWHNAVLVGSGRPRPKQLVQRWVARRADLVSGASADLVEQARQLGASEAVLAPVPSPRVPALLRRSLGRAEREALRRRLITAPMSDDAVLVLTVSRIAPQKNLGVLVAVAAALVDGTARGTQRAPAQWFLVGDGDADLSARISEQVATTGAPLHLVGSRSDIGDWLAAADLFVLTSSWEARALVVQEAMAAGVPVVASRVGGLPELLDGVGVLVPLDDQAVQHFAAVVQGLLADPDRRADLGRRGRAAAAALPDGPAVARQWRDRYARLVAER